MQNEDTNSNPNNNLGEIKVSEEMFEVLTKVSAQLPRGYKAKIANKIEKSDEYVRLFFKGQIPITEETMKILDLANKMIDVDGAREDQRENKAMAIATEIIQKTSKPETDF